MRAVVDRLQGAAPQPPGRVALSGRLRLGTGSERRGASVPDVAQPLSRVSGPEGDQFQTPDVTGELELRNDHPQPGAWLVLPAPLSHTSLLHSDSIYLQFLGDISLDSLSFPPKL